MACFHFQVETGTFFKVLFVKILLKVQEYFIKICDLYSFHLVIKLI